MKRDKGKGRKKAERGIWTWLIYLVRVKTKKNNATISALQNTLVTRKVIDDYKI